MKADIQEKDIEFALQMLNLPEREQDAGFREWIQQEDHRELFRRLLVLREAGLLELRKESINVDRQWRQFDHHVIRPARPKIWRWAVSAAAMLLLGYGIYNWWDLRNAADENTLAQVEYHLEKGVVLVSEEEQPMSVIVPQTKHIPGVKTFVRDSLRGISYSGAVLQEEVRVKHHTLRVPRAADYMVILEDSTCVWVNAESELRYPSHFGEGNRVVELKGEAYFKVRPDASRPFIVRTERAETRVLGTEFNMQAYPEHPLNVTLVEGSVRVKASAGEVLLKPGENAVLTDRVLKVETVDVLKYTSWKSGYFYYDGVCLGEILEELGRWYDFTVSYEDEALKLLRFKFWAGRYEPLERMLDHLNEMHRVKLSSSGTSVFVEHHHNE